MKENTLDLLRTIFGSYVESLQLHFIDQREQTGRTESTRRNKLCVNTRKPCPPESILRISYSRKALQCLQYIYSIDTSNPLISRMTICSAFPVFFSFLLSVLITYCPGVFCINTDYTCLSTIQYHLITPSDFRVKFMLHIVL